MAQPYYGFVRSEIEPLLPKSASRILDVGCGIGATAAWLKKKYPGSSTVGLEGNAALFSELAANVDEAHIVDLNGALPTVARPDLVLLLDVLEHLLEPQAVLANLVSLATHDACFIISLPNVAHLSVSLPLLLQGRFEYADAGILDRTHLHFYTVTSAIELANSAGLVVRHGVLSGLGGPRSRLADRLTLGLFRARLAKQCIIAATHASGSHQGTVTWTTN